MPPDNVDVARQAMDALGRRDTDCLISLLHPDVEWHSFFALGEGGPYRGHDGTKQYMRDLSDAWEIGEAQGDVRGSPAGAGRRGFCGGLLGPGSAAGRGLAINAQGAGR